MEMFDLTKNHKGDILISGAASKYSGSWTIFEAPEASGRGKCRAAWPLRPSTGSARPPCPDPKPWPAGRGSPRFAEHRKRPWESAPPLFPAEEVGEGCFPQPPGGANSGRGLINHTEIPATWLCSFAFTISGDKLHAALASLGWSLEGWGKKGGSPCSGETCQLLGLVRRQRRQTQCCCCWFDLELWIVSLALTMW